MQFYEEINKHNKNNALTTIVLYNMIIIYFYKQKVILLRVSRKRHDHQANRSELKWQNIFQSHFLNNYYLWLVLTFRKAEPCQIKYFKGRSFDGKTSKTLDYSISSVYYTITYYKCQTFNLKILLKLNRGKCHINSIHFM